MIPQNIVTLINALIEKTISKKAEWGKTSRENEFKLFLENAAITTDSWLDNNKNELVDFAIYNSFGDKIDSYDARKEDEEFELLSTLHSSAKREFYKVDETIGDLMKVIDSQQKIGKRTVEKNEFPF